MSLHTRVAIMAACDPGAVFAACRELLGVPADAPTRTGTFGDDNPDRRGSQWLALPMDVPAPAWLHLSHGAGGPMPWHDLGAYAEVSFTTGAAYAHGSRHELHTRLVAALGRRLGARGLPWSWADDNSDGWRRNPAEDAFQVGWALLTGRAAAGVDDPVEAARGAFRTAIGHDDGEWSPRAAYQLAELEHQHGDAVAAQRYALIAIRSGHRDWAPAGQVVLGVLLAGRGEHAAAARAYRAAIAGGHPDHAPAAWFDLGVLHQELERDEDAITAFRAAVASGHPVWAQKAGVNLGVVLARHGGDEAGAREAFAAAAAGSDAEQRALAQRNLDALDEGATDGVLSRMRRWLRG